MARKFGTRASVIAAAAVVAALSACNPLTTTLSRQVHTKPTAHHIALPSKSPDPRPTTTPAPTPTTSATPTSNATPTSTPTSSPTVSATDAYEARILVLVNQERAKVGLAGLRANSCADGYAERWAPVIQSNGVLSHQELGPILNACHAMTVGENVAYGNMTADEMMTMWMNSPGHKANILNPAFTGIGVAAVTDSSGRWYGVQDFVG